VKKLWIRLWIGLLAAIPSNLLNPRMALQKRFSKVRKPFVDC